MAHVCSGRAAHLPHSDFVIATCERGDLRLSPDGITIHDVHGTGVVSERGIGRGPGRTLTLWAALRDGRRVLQDATLGKATWDGIGDPAVSQERREIGLS